MGQIREEFILTDQFSATFSRFLQMGQSSENRLGALERSNEELAEASSYAARQLEAMRGALAAQQSLYSSQNQRLERQGRRVQELTQAYQRLINTRGAEAAATLRAGEALNRAQLAESRIHQQALRTAETISRQNEEIQRFTQRMNSARSATDRAAAAQNKHKKQISDSGKAMERLLTTVKRVAVATIGFSLIKQMVQLSDATVQTTARLNLMAREGENVAQIQESIYQSAQRTGTSYMATADVVSKLGLRAGDAFSGSAEIIQFAENLNKQFVIAGASQQEISSASLQLTQALGSGVLRGEELNAVFEAAPNIIQTIADYLGVGIGEIRSLASDGQITAEIVKNAMLSATDTINEQFESMPMTWGRAWTMIKNAGVRSLEAVSNKINDLLNSDTGKTIIEGLIGSMEFLAGAASLAVDVMARGAQFVIENWDAIQPVLIGIGTAFLVAGLAATAAWIAAAWPFILIAAVVIGLSYALGQLGVTAGQVGSVVGKTFGFLYAVGYNLVADWLNLFTTFGEFFANFMDNPVAAVGHLISNLLDTILGMVETVAGAIDALLGSDISGAVSGFRNNLIEKTNKVFGEQEIKLDRIEKLDIGTTMEEWGEIGADLGSKLDNMNFSLDSLTKSMSGFDPSSIPSIGEIGDVGNVGKVKSIEDDIKLSDEDLKLYRDLAERKYMNQVELKTLAPQINVSIPETAAGNISAQDVADKLKVLLIEQMGAGTAVSHG